MEEEGKKGWSEKKTTKTDHRSTYFLKDCGVVFDTVYSIGGRVYDGRRDWDFVFLEVMVGFRDDDLRLVLDVFHLQSIYSSLQLRQSRLPVFADKEKMRHINFSQAYSVFTPRLANARVANGSLN